MAGGIISIPAHQNEPLDRLLWRVLGRIEGVLEQALRDNPGLAAQADALPEGRIVHLQVDPGDTPTRRRPLIQLWD